MPSTLLKEFIVSLGGKAVSTVEAYQRELRHFLDWISRRAGNSGPFNPQQQLTKTALQTYMAYLQSENHSISHCARVKSAVGAFARWLIEEKELLRRNPARGEALFALGYWAGCRISDVAWLRMEHLHIGPKVGWVHVGYKGGKTRDIDLLNSVRRPLYTYLQQGDRDQDSSFVFSSQRAARFTEAGIHHWFRSLKARANKEEWSLIHDITFHGFRLLKLLVGAKSLLPTDFALWCRCAPSTPAPTASISTLNVA